MENQEFQLSDTLECLYVVSDIHAFAAPLAALDAWLANEKSGRLVAFCGDVCDGGIDPAEASGWVLRHAQGRAVLGNHDERMLRGEPADGGAHTDAGALQRLDAAGRAFWQARPLRVVLHWHGRRIVLMHGHRTPCGQAASWRAAPAEQAANFLDPSAALVVLGHTHYPYVQRLDSTLVANPGSVSLPILAVEDEHGLHPQGGSGAAREKEDLRGSFLRVCSSGNGLTVDVIPIEYDRAHALQRLEAYGHPKLEYFRRWMTEGVVSLRLL